MMVKAAFLGEFLRRSSDSNRLLPVLCWPLLAIPSQLGGRCVSMVQYVECNGAVRFSGTFRVENAEWRTGCSRKDKESIVELPHVDADKVFISRQGTLRPRSEDLHMKGSR